MDVAPDPGIDWNAEPDLDLLRRSAESLFTATVQAMTDLEQLAERGSAMSMLQLGFAYGNVPGVTFDRGRQEYWYKRAAVTGSLYASMTLGRFYCIVDRYQEAVAEFERGLAGSYAPSIYLLAGLYYRGEGVEKNLGKYKKYLIKATTLGHLLAERSLAKLLLSGRYGFVNFLRGAGLWVHSCQNIRIVSRKNPESVRLTYK
jgi:TPR repeat protein